MENVKLIFDPLVLKKYKLPFIITIITVLVIITITIYLVVKEQKND